MAMSLRMRRVTILLVFIVVVSGGLFGAWTIRGVRRAQLTHDRLTEGMKLYEQHQYKDALERLGYVTGQPEGRSDAKVLTAVADCRLRVPMPNGKHLTRAAQFAQMAHDLDPKQAEPLQLLLKIYERLGFSRELIDAADGLLAIDPKNHDAMRLKIIALDRLGRTDDSLAAAQEMSVLYPVDAGIQGAIVQIMSNAGKSSSELLAYTTELVKNHPSNAEFSLLHLNVAVHARDQDRVQAESKRLLTLKLTNPDDLASTISQLDSLGMSGLAESFLEKHAKLNTFENAARLIRADRQWKAGNVDSAESLLDELIVDPANSSADALGLDVFLHEFNHKDQTVAPLLSELESRDSDDARQWLKIIEIFRAIESDKIDDAKSALEALEPQQSSAEYLYLAQARVQRSQGELSLAADALRRSISAEPRWLTTRLMYINVLTSLADHAEAMRQARMTVRLFPSNLAAYVAVIDTVANATEQGIASTSDHDAALKLLNALQKQEVQSATINVLSARLNDVLGRASGAKEAIQNIIDSKLTPTPREFAQLLRVARHLHDASLSAQLSKLADSLPKTPEIVLSQALSAADDGRSQEGEQVLRSAINSSNDDEKSDYQRALATFLLRTGNPEGAHILQQLAEDNPQSAEMQVAFLRTDQAWEDEPAVKQALGNLNAILSETSTIWQIFNARRILTFNPSEKATADAAQQLERIARVDPANVEALALLADAMVRLGDPSTAADYLSRAVDLNRGRASLYPVLIHLYQQSGRSDNARRRLSEFVALGDLTASLRRQRAQLLIFQGMWDEAQRDLEYLYTQGDPQDTLTLAKLYARRGEPDKARPLFNQLLAAPEPTSSSVEAAADFRASQGDIKGGAELIRSLLDDRDGIDARAVVAAFYERNGRDEDARKLYISLANELHTSDAWARLAAYYIRSGEDEKALDAVKQGLKSDPESDQLAALNTLILGTTDASDSSTALSPEMKALLQTDALKPKDGEDPSAYLQAVRRVTGTYPTYLPAWQTLILAQLNSGKRDEAIESARAATQAIPAHPRTHELLTEALAQAGKSTEAIAAARTWKERSLDRPFDADLALATLHAQIGHEQDALMYIQPYAKRIIQDANSQRDRSDALSLYATLLVANGREAEAHSLFLPSTKGIAPFVRAYFSAVGRLMKTPGQARAWLNDADDILNQNASSQLAALGKTWYDLATITELESDYLKAIDILEPLLDEEDLTRDVGATLGTAYDQIGQFEKAEAAYRRSLQEDTDQPIVLNNLAYLLIRTKPGSDEALQFATRAVDLSQVQNLSTDLKANLLDTLATAQRTAGQLAKSTTTYRRALALTPDNVDILLSLAEVLFAQHEDHNTDAELNTLVTRLNAIDARGELSQEAKARLEMLSAQLQSAP